MGAIGAIGAVTMLVATVASAQTTALEQRPLVEQYVDTTSGLTLADAIAGALEREPSLRATRAELEMARGGRQQAGLRANPSIMFERRSEPAGSDNQTMLQVSIPLELFRRSTRIGVAQRELEVTESFVADRVRMLVNDIRMRYGQAAAAARELAVADSLASSVGRDLELLRRRVEEGASPPLDRDRMAVDVHRLDAARMQAVGRAEAAMVDLKHSLGLGPDSAMKLREPLEVLAALPSSAGALDLRERADVREADARVRLAQARVGHAQSEGRFDLALFGSYMRMDAGFPQRGFGAAGELEPVHGVFHYATAGAMVMVPLWNRNQGAIATARGEHAAAVARLEAARLSVQAQVAAAAARVAQTTKALRGIADGLILARQNLDVVRQTYELGRGTLSDVLAEQRRYFEFEGEYTSALREAFEARTSLEFARGEAK